MAEQREPTQQELANEIASIDRAIHEALFYGGGLKLLINADETLRSRGGAKGLAIYDDIERDCHAGAVLDKRKRAVTAREWSMKPASDDPLDVAIAEQIEQMLEDLRFDQLTKQLLDAVLKGYAIAEIMWASRDNLLVPARFIARDQRRFTFDTDSRLRLLTKERPVEGEELPDRKFLVHTYGGKDGSPYGRGLGSKLFWPVFFKRQNITFWLTFNDKFGSPTAVGKYPSGASKADQSNLLSALQAISRDAGVIVPEGMVIELLEAARSGNADGYERLCAYMDAEISKAVLGETLTTTVGNSGGNRALGDVHQEVRRELAKDDADDLSYTLNETLIKWVCEYNWPGRKPPSVWREFDEAEDLDKVASRDSKLAEMGYERTEESVQEVYGTGYVRKQQPAPTVVPPNDPRGTPATPTMQFAEEAGFRSRMRAAVARVLGFAESDPAEAQRDRNRVDQETLAEGSEQLAESWQEFVGPRVREIQTLLDETGDLQLARQRLGELLEREPSAEFIEALSRATFAARLQGRLPKA